MANASLPPLDPAFKEHLNEFGEMLMNRFNDRVDKLIEHLTPTTHGNSPGVVNGATPGGVEMQRGDQIPNGGTAEPAEQLPHQPQPLPREEEVVPQRAPQANRPPVVPLASHPTPQHIPNMHGQASPNPPPPNPDQGFEAQASYQPPGRHRPHFLGDNNAEYSYPQRVLDF